MALVVGGLAHPVKLSRRGVDPPRFSESVQRIHRTCEHSEICTGKGVGQLRRSMTGRKHKVRCNLKRKRKVKGNKNQWSWVYSPWNTRYPNVQAGRAQQACVVIDFRRSKAKALCFLWCYYRCTENRWKAQTKAPNECLRVTELHKNFARFFSDYKLGICTFKGRNRAKRLSLNWICSERSEQKNMSEANS